VSTDVLHSFYFFHSGSYEDCSFFLYSCIKGVILTGPGSVWFGNVVILTRPVQWTATRLRFGLRPKWIELANRFISVQYGRTCFYAKVWAEK